MEPAEALSTNEWRQLSSKDKFRRYLSVLGLPRQFNADTLTNRLKREHRDIWTRFSAVVEERGQGNMNDDLYAIKNENLQFSLLTTLFERHDFHLETFIHLDQVIESVSSILDVGCENGFLTCLLALCWPNARVVGVDSSKMAIERARELASLLKVKNIEFILGNAEKIPDIFKGQSFDLITTITMLHDAGLLSGEDQPFVQASDVFKSIAISSSVSSYQAIASALSQPKGSWISVERSPSPATFSMWCQTMDSVGLGLDWKKSIRKISADGFLAIIYAGFDCPRPLNLNEAHGAWLRHDFNQWGTTNEPPWILRDQQAEVFFAQLNPKVCVNRLVGSDIYSNEIGRLEIWKTETLALDYDVSHYSGITRLQIRPIVDLAVLRDHWEKAVSKHRAEAPPNIQFEEFRIEA